MNRDPAEAESEELTAPDPGLGESGVSDFGISAGLPSGGAAERVPHPYDPRFELAAAVRRVTTAMVGANLADEDIKLAAAAIAEIADDLERRAGPGKRPRSQPDPAGHPQEFFPTSPVVGFANPIAPPVVIESVDGGLGGHAWFDYPYEGPPSCVHGGVIAMVFDEIMGAATIAAGCPAMTGTLTIRYRKPTPLRSALRVEARCTGRERRKTYVRAAIYHEDLLTAEAEGIFVRVVPERFLSMVAAAPGAAEVVEQIRADAEHLKLFMPEGQPGG